jgi:spore germination protein
MKKRKVKRMILLLLLEILLIPLLTGCWSSKKVEDLNIIIGSAVDSAGKEKLKATLQVAVPQALATGKNNGGGGQTKPYVNISEEGVALEPIGWETTLKKEGILFGSHQKTIILGEELAKEVNLEEVMDLYYRDVDIRGSALIFIAKGEANKTLEMKDPTIIPALHINEMATQQLTTKIVKPMTLTKILGNFEGKSSFILQQIVSKNGEVRFEGAAIIEGKSKKLIGTFTNKEIEGINWLTGESKSGAVKAYHSKTDHPVFYQIKSMKSEIVPKVKGDYISFDVKIKSEGRIAEYWNPYSKPAFQNRNVKQIEIEAEKEVESLVGNVLDQMQKEYKVDVAGFGNQLRIKYPKVWENVKNDWDQTFSEVPIHYHADLTIKDYGMVGRKRTK